MRHHALIRALVAELRAAREELALSWQEHVPTPEDLEHLRAALSNGPGGLRPFVFVTTPTGEDWVSREMRRRRAEGDRTPREYEGQEITAEELAQRALEASKRGLKP